MTSHERPFICCECPGMCGVLVSSSAEGTVVRGDPSSPISAGYSCDLAAASLEAASCPDRVTTPLRRAGDGWESISWEQALSEIGARAKEIAKSSGADAIALHAGERVGTDPICATQLVSLAIQMGTPNLFSDLVLHGGPLLTASEEILGWPSPLQSDPGRAHVTILLGDCDQSVGAWGPLQRGTVHLQAMRHIQRARRSAKLFAVSSTGGPLVAEADQHLAIRPGSELFFLLGLCHTIIASRWYDTQYVRDYCSNFEAARAWLEPWTPAVAAAACGISADELSGVALAFSRAPMATIVRSDALMRGPSPTVAAWAWHLAHALTANLLRPGGAYEAKGPIDLQPLLASFPHAKAPRAEGSTLRTTLLQSPSTALPGSSARALISFAGDPLSSLPGRDEVQRFLEELDLFVVVDHRVSESAALADYILPSTTPWEQQGSHLLDGPLLPFGVTDLLTPPLTPPGEVRESTEVARSLAGVLPGASLLGNPYGLHLRAAAKWALSADLDKMVGRLTGWFLDKDRSEVVERHGGIERGEVNRAEIRIFTPDERFDLAPGGLIPAINAIPSPPASGPLLATTRSPRGRRHGWLRSESAEDVTIGLHPDSGFEQGASVRVSTASGSVVGEVRLDESLHPHAVDIPWEGGLAVNRVVGSGRMEPLSGAVQMTGIPCELSLE